MLGRQIYSYLNLNLRRWLSALGCCLVLPCSPGFAAEPLTPATTPPASNAPAPDVQMIIALPTSWPAAQREQHTAALRQLLALLPNELRSVAIVVENDAGSKSSNSLQQAIADAAQQWRSGNSKDRSLIIIAADAGGVQNEQGKPAQDIILNEWLPRLRQSNVQIYTIAADVNADQRLLSQLAISSDGWFFPYLTESALTQHVITALQSIAPRDTLPIEDGLLKIDDQVQATTMLLYRADPKTAPRLIAPLGEPFSEFNPPSNIKWIANPTYDLIHITKPRIGSWQLEIDDNPDNRATIRQSDLTLMVSTLPRNMLVGQRQIVNIELRKNGARVSDKAVLEQLALKVAMWSDNKTQRLWYPVDNGEGSDSKAEDGIFTVVLDGALAAGEIDLIADIEGVSIKRRHQQHFRVHAAPAAQLFTNEQGTPVLSVTPRMGMLDPSTLIALAHITLADGSELTLPLTQYTTTEWRGNPIVTNAQSVEINIQATTPTGEPMSIWLEPLSLNKNTTGTHAAAPTYAGDHDSVSGKSLHAHSKELKAEHAHDQLDDHATPTPTPLWLITLQQLALINLVLIATSVGTMWWRRRRNSHFARHIMTVLAP